MERCGEGEQDPATEQAAMAVAHLAGSSAGSLPAAKAQSSRWERLEGGKEPGLILTPAMCSKIPLLIFDHLLQTGTMLARSESAASLPVPSGARGTAQRFCSHHTYTSTSPCP